MGYITPTTDNNFNGWANRETWAFNMWIGSSQPLHNLAEMFVRYPIENHIDDISAVTNIETLNFISAVREIALSEKKDIGDTYPSKNDAYNMAVDMSEDSTPNFKGFQDVNAFETATALNELFDLKEPA
jgi:hypothetical protein